MTSMLCFLSVVVGTNVVVIFLTVSTIFLCFDSAGKTFRKLQVLHARGNADSTGSDAGPDSVSRYCRVDGDVCYRGKQLHFLVMHGGRLARTCLENTIHCNYCIVALFLRDIRLI